MAKVKVTVTMQGFRFRVLAELDIGMEIDDEVQNGSQSLRLWSKS